MSEGCTHDCSSCSQNCASRDPKSLIEKPNEHSKIKRVIGIVSGKGGVGKSLVTSMLAVLMQRKGYRCAVLDADITGPSIPKVRLARRKVFSLHSAKKALSLCPSISFLKTKGIPLFGEDL